jgi:hypothetical protein
MYNIEGDFVQQSVERLKSIDFIQFYTSSKQLVDQLFGHRQSALPEGGIAGVEAERLEQLGLVLGAAGREHGEIAFGKTFGGALTPHRLP